MDNRIQVDRRVLAGRPVIRGTRIPVELLLRRLAEGATAAELLAEYPQLTRADLRAVMAYAADLVSRERVALPYGE